MQIYLARNNQQAGPYSVEQLNQMLASQQVLLTDLAWHQGMAEWKTLGELTQGELFYEVVGDTTTPPLTQPSSYQNDAIKKIQVNPKNSQLASLPARALAKLIDMLLWIPASIILASFLEGSQLEKMALLQQQFIEKIKANDATAVLDIQNQMFNLFPDTAWLAMFAYLFIMIAIQAYLLAKSGQSIGKKLAKIKIVDAETDEKVSFIRVFAIRSVVFIVIYRFFSLFAIIDFLFALGQKRQTLHDKLAKTKVIKQ